MTEATRMPPLRRAWLTEMGVGHIWLGGAARTPQAPAPEPAPTAAPSQPQPQPAPAAITPPATPRVRGPQPTISAAAVAADPVGKAALEPAPAGVLVCRVYRLGEEAAAWLVAVDAAELGQGDGGPRLFLGRMLRAIGLRRTQTGADLPLLAGEDGPRCSQTLDVACVAERPSAVLLVGPRAAQAFLAQDDTDTVSLQERQVPVAALPALSDVALDAAGKARAWRLLCALRSRSS